ncbi:MAG: hypothetical protein IJZ26_00710 [Clostridia bacterium]|nr:hypothetical protein [Clostridia bacterium]
MFCQNKFYEREYEWENKRNQAFNCPCEINCPWEQYRQQHCDYNKKHDNDCSQNWCNNRPCHPEKPKKQEYCEFCIEGKIIFKDNCGFKNNKFYN